MPIKKTTTEEMHKLARAHDSAETALNELLAYAERERESTCIVYHLGKSILARYFNQNEVDKAMLEIALRDQHDDDDFLAKKAKALIDSFNQDLCFNSFVNELSSTDTATLKAVDRLYFAHKIKENKYQVSVFLKGVGLAKKSKHNSIEEILDTSMAGAGIPAYAEYLSKNEYQKIRKNFHA